MEFGYKRRAGYIVEGDFVSIIVVDKFFGGNYLVNQVPFGVEPLGEGLYLLLVEIHWQLLVV